MSIRFTLIKGFVEVLLLLSLEYGGIKFILSLQCLRFSHTLILFWSIYLSIYLSGLYTRDNILVTVVSVV